MKIDTAAEKLKEKILNLDINSLNASDYFKNYLRSYQDDIDAVIPRYVRILKESLKGHRRSCTAFLDYGGGSGFLTMLAKLSGIHRVVYMDISEEIRNGAAELSSVLSIPVDAYYTGTYESLEIDEKFDVIANYDVLEHVYDPFKAFKALSELLTVNGTIYMASGSNTYHPVIYWMMTKKHEISEYSGTVSGKKMDAKEPFFEIRKTIIKTNFPSLCEDEISKLAEKTRGFREEDIISIVDMYTKSDLMPLKVHKNNTCDPYTGNWDENLISYFSLARKLRTLFKRVEILPGYYPEVDAEFKRTPDVKDKNIINKVYPYLSYLSVKLAPFLNSLIRLLPGNSKFTVAPYYVIKASYKKNHADDSTQKIAEIYDKWDAWNEDVKPMDITLPYTPGISLKKVVEFLDKKKFSKESAILDAGCGNGNAVLTMKNMGYNPEACDISKQASVVLNNFKQGSVTDLPYNDENFDLVYSLSVLHHLDDIEQGLREFARVLKTGGYFIASFHTRNSLYYLETLVKRKLFPKKFKHYDYVTFSTVSELLDMFRKNGFAVESFDGIHPFWLINKFIEISEFLKRKGIVNSNPFVKLEKILSGLIPQRMKTEISYHAIFVCKKVK